MIGGYKAELKRDYCVFILDKDIISNMKTNGRQCVGVNSPIFLSITSKDSFTYKESKRRPDLEDFPCFFFFFLLHDFLT
jgi:vacuolar-type H+-ATPase subunit F/Vma7